MNETADGVIEFESPAPPQLSVRWSPTFTKIFAALIKAQSEMGAAIKDSTNPFYNNSRYADLSENLFVCKKPLNDNGIGIFQPLTSIPHGVRVTTLLMHTSGEWVASELDFPAEKQDPQTYGKVATYARRYSLNAILSIPSEDDDANAASHPNGAPAKPMAKVQVKPQATTQQSVKAQAPLKNGEVAICAPKTAFFKEWAGKPLSEMPRAQLDWYAEALHQDTEDPNKAKYKPQNEATLKLFIAEIDKRNALNRELDEQAAKEAQA